MTEHLRTASRQHPRGEYAKIQAPGLISGFEGGGRAVFIWAPRRHVCAAGPAKVKLKLRSAEK